MFELIWGHDTPLGYILQLAGVRYDLTKYDYKTLNTIVEERVYQIVSDRMYMGASLIRCWIVSLITCSTAHLLTLLHHIY